MKYKYWVSVLLLLSIVSLSSADMYIWVDENGVKHYTDRAPAADEVPPEQLRQTETATYVFGHPLYNKSGEIEYCGSTRLPYLHNNDFDRYLHDAMRTQKLVTEARRKLSSQLAAATSEKHRESLRKVLSECECILGWADYTINKIESTKPDKNEERPY